MNINKLCRGNAVKYNNRYGTIMSQLNYNEYLIEHCGKPTIVNVLDLNPIEIRSNEMRNLGFSKKGKRTDEKSKRTSIVWTKNVLVPLNEEENVKFEQEMNIDLYKDTSDLRLEDLTGIDHFLPDEYKYVHQIQNLLSYVINEMPEYNN